MRVEELVLDGFKSYAVRTVISSWDPQFNAITGLNGSGKSNILDAICFVLGISSMSTVRATNLQDLIYKRGQAGITKASVTITFDNADKTKSPIGFEQYPKISISRQVLLGGASKYLINGHKVQQSQILNLFQSVQLNINNPNFLIMQGKITKMLNMKPTEILGLIEEAAGTKMYEGQREKAERIMAKKNIKLKTTESLLVEEVEPKLRQLREQKRIVMEFQDILIELETLSKAVAAHDYRSLYQKQQEQESQVNSDCAKLNSLKSKKNVLENEIHTLENDLVVTRTKKQNEIGRGRNLKELEQTETDLTNQMTRTVTSKDLKIQILEQETSKLDKLRRRQAECPTDLQPELQSFEAAEQEYISRKVILEKLECELRQREELLSSLSTGFSSKGSSEGGYLSQLQESKQRLSAINVEIEKYKLKKKHLNDDLESKKHKIVAAKNDITVLEKKLESKIERCSALSQIISSAGFDSETLKSLKNEERVTHQKLNDLRKSISKLFQRYPGISFEYDMSGTKLDKDSVKGLVGELFLVPEANSKYSTALEVCAGGKLYNVVVDTEKSGSELLENGNLKKRVTIIPLNKITAQSLSSGRLEAAKELAPGKVELALHTLEYPHEFTKAMEFIFGNRLLCEDPETAKKVTFNPNVRTGSITLEGDFYDPEGRLSGGSKQNSSSLLAAFEQLRQLKNQESHILGRLKQIQAEITNQESLSKETRAVQQELSTETYQRDILVSQLKDCESAKLLEKIRAHQLEADSLQEMIEKSLEEGRDVQQEIYRLKKDLQDFDSDGESKLADLRHEIEELRVRIPEEQKAVKTAHKSLQVLQIEREEKQNDLSGLQEQIGEAENLIQNLKHQLRELDSECLQLKTRISEVKIACEKEKSAILGINDELQEMTQTLNLKRQELNDLDVALGKQSDKSTKSEAQLNLIQESVRKIIENQEWVTDEKLLNQVLEQYPNINVEHCHKRIDQLKTRSSSMRKKGVNNNIMAQIEQHEKHELSLKTKIRQINKDKAKIEDTVRKLDDYKRTELLKTYNKVSKDFGQIFADLLPQAYAKLVLTDQKDVTKGLEVRVKLGNVWKESLVELSGGQRSLVALSLIMSLLQFKPAPMYILDEVDAALDLSHTQNIGHLIKTRFKGSQFIVVSLKEGMFTNANRLFKVRFQEGTSVVTAS
ncbi:hypothetical protein OGAPHI_001311 [Ogataea philodendri]|uniref:Structural maintenance of chromosomes protein n=1 Tax=Ogataea philodendri TaxID=1378263 RepID=A0A9P8PFW0_9ASCO|nr:uncharacterized protein OGAPHI_001311 [Ogataea philodendri]KAH3670795.1 hypothetical protein OGAPHI_001311 [Ogataea philodendri]